MPLFSSLVQAEADSANMGYIMLIRAQKLQLCVVRKFAEAAAVLLVMESLGYVVPMLVGL